MIFLDTNLILRSLVAPVTDQDRIWQSQAATLLRKVSSGEVQATVSEVVLHEVCFILGSKRHYALQPLDIVERVRSILALPGIRLAAGDEAIFRRALELWSNFPKLDFSDAVIAARCERAGHELATFDRHFAAIPSLTLWRPEPEESAPEASEPAPS